MWHYGNANYSRGWGKEKGQPFPTCGDEFPSKGSGLNHQPELLLWREAGCVQARLLERHLLGWAEWAHKIGPTNTTRTPTLQGPQKWLYQNLH